MDEAEAIRSRLQDDPPRDARGPPQRLVRLSSDGSAGADHRAVDVLGRPAGPGPGARPRCDVIVGLDTDDPTVALERTEFVRADQTYSILARIVRATRVDTILHTFLRVDSTGLGDRALHEINVIGTMNLLAAAAAAGQLGAPRGGQVLDARLRLVAP